MIMNLPEDARDIQGLAYMGVCGVIATAVVTGRSYKEVYDYYAPLKTNPRSNNVPLRQHEWLGGMKHFGSEVELHHDLTKKFKNGSLQKLMHYLALTDPTTVYVVRTTRHVQVVKGGVAIDQGGPEIYYKFWGRRKRIWGVFSVDPQPKLMDSEIQQTLKEVSIMTTKKVSKFNRAVAIVPGMVAAGEKRKDILAHLAAELDTTWGCASTFYHRILKDIRNKEKENA